MATIDGAAALGVGDRVGSIHATAGVCAACPDILTPLISR